jgi:hypothetical protein
VLIWYCFVCDRDQAQLSFRGRCASCEAVRSIANEEENEQLRSELETLKDEVARPNMEVDGLTAGQCLHPGSLLGDEQGSLHCTKHDKLLIINEDYENEHG